MISGVSSQVFINIHDVYKPWQLLDNLRSVHHVWVIILGGGGLGSWVKKCWVSNCLRSVVGCIIVGTECVMVGAACVMVGAECEMVGAECEMMGAELKWRVFFFE